MAEFFTREGISSIAVHSELSLEERQRRIAGYVAGTFVCIFVRDIFNEGVDFPDTEALIFLRPTASKIVFIQQLGRGLRLNPGKKNVLVLDFIGNYIGATNVASTIIQLGTGDSKEREEPKPQYVFENGCKVTFSAKTIESLSIPTHVVYDKAKYIEAIARRFETLQRPLNPLDVYIATGSDFGPLLMSMNGYRRVVERMNSLDEGVCILDPKFSDLDPLASGEDEIDTEFVGDLVSQLVVQCFELVDAVRKFDGRMKRKSNRAVFDFFAIQENIIVSISPLFFLKGLLASAPSKHIRQGKEFSGTPSWSISFFDYIRDQSNSRNSYAMSNYLRENFGFFCFVASLERRNLGADSLIHVGNRLLEKRNVVWLSDFLDLISQGAFQPPFEDGEVAMYEEPTSKLPLDEKLAFHQNRRMLLTRQEKDALLERERKAILQQERNAQKQKKQEALLEESIEILTQYGPLGTGDIYDKLITQGVKIGGGYPVENLKTAMANSKLVKYDCTEKVWQLKPVGQRTLPKRTRGS